MRRLLSCGVVTTPRRILLPVLLTLVASACAQTFQAGAALVNGTKITEEDLDAAIVAQSGQVAAPVDEAQRLQQARQALSVLIQQELIRQEADARGFAISADEAEIEGFYEFARDQYRQAKIKHILFRVDEQNPDQRAERRARATLVQIQAGESFERLARQRSEDPGSADSGGRLPGWTALSQLDPTFAQAVQDATVGEVTEPVRTQFGWHLIMVIDRRVQPLRDVAPQIRAQLEQQAGDSAFQEFLQQLTRDADVEVNPRYGDWDPESATITPHSFLTPPEPVTDPLAPPAP